ncbi:hypothetical protein ACFQZZ_31940 [Nocardia sp. GCM10030253]|uniref:hypothetical protein n=1 Tax=Nocardia sp. GCM10030253 TaxID=3273404 RepID=UPI00362B2E59
MGALVSLEQREQVRHAVATLTGECELVHGNPEMSTLSTLTPNAGRSWRASVDGGQAGECETHHVDAIASIQEGDVVEGDWAVLVIDQDQVGRQPRSCEQVPAARSVERGAAIPASNAVTTTTAPFCRETAWRVVNRQANCKTKGSVRPLTRTFGRQGVGGSNPVIRSHISPGQ